MEGLESYRRLLFHASNDSNKSININHNRQSLVTQTDGFSIINHPFKEVFPRTPPILMSRLPQLRCQDERVHFESMAKEHVEQTSDLEAPRKVSKRDTNTKEALPNDRCGGWLMDNL